jgi:virulence-associated protein VapD
MSKIDKLIKKLMLGKSDNNFDFDDLRKVIEHFGFEYRNKGSSHYVYSRKDIYDRLNIQRDKNSSQAKPYQVKQVREIINNNFNKNE